MTQDSFFDRDLSWLSFNGRVLDEAQSPAVPLLEKIKFLSIFSSNLDEFYRVRMPVLLALEKLSKKASSEIELPNHLLKQTNDTILQQLQSYGTILKSIIIPDLKKFGVHFYYEATIPDLFKFDLQRYFSSQILAFLQPVQLDSKTDFFPQNNALYLLVKLESRSVILNIPSTELPRFFKIKHNDETHIFFIDDIIRENLNSLFPNEVVLACHSFKVTRTAELDLKDEYKKDLAEQIEKQLQKRDFGLATRLLIQPGVSDEVMDLLVTQLNLKKATRVSGGCYHNLKDFADFPYTNSNLENEAWPKINYPPLDSSKSLNELILKRDILINPPYQSYDAILRFFNEAATDQTVEEIYCTMYRVAKDSKIVNALISAAKNGKKVVVLVELKARFDEENNIKWAKKMRAAGVNILYSVTALKVHAKIAMVKRRYDLRTVYTGLLATGNFNETTANFYTDHILMTANRDLLREMELLFIFLAKRAKPGKFENIPFKHLLVAQFNLLERFEALIDREIDHAKQGRPASIVIKMNNLEEKVLIEKLYQAAKAGVSISLIVRGICRLIPGLPDQLVPIRVSRIVDRYLEHGRLFLFFNNGKEELFMGSADWMNRNVYRRIEVCFPIIDLSIKAELKTLLNFQLNDTAKAVFIDEHLNTYSADQAANLTQSQYEIYQFLKNKSHE